MPPALPVFARRRDGEVVAVGDSVTMRFVLSDLRSGDGHTFAAYLTATARLVDRPADRELFAERFLNGRDQVTADDVRHAFAAELQAVAAAFVSQDSAEIAIRRCEELKSQLLQKADALGFACGLAFGPPAELTLDSDSLRQTRQTQDARRRQLDAADHAAALAGRLAAVGPASRLVVSDQAALLPSLLAAVPIGRVLLTAGPNVVAIEADGTPRPIAGPDAVGPLRCVCDVRDGTFAVGGANGVAILDSELSVVRMLTGGVGSGRGFNSVAKLPDGRIVATHSEIGVAVWKDDSVTPIVLATPGVARSVMVVDRRAVFACGSAVCTLDGDAVQPIEDGPSSIITLLAAEAGVRVVRQDGTVTTLDRATLHPIGQARVPGPVVAATALTAGGLDALLISDGRSLNAFTAAGEPLARLPAAPGGVRMLAVAGGRVASVSTDRASMAIWDAAEPDAPPRSIHVVARTGHHVTDLIGTAL